MRYQPIGTKNEVSPGNAGYGLFDVDLNLRLRA
jgi:hypothetical protein